MEKKKARVAVLVSGGGTNLQAIIDAEKSGIIHSGMVALVVSNNENAYAVKRAEQAGIPSRILLRRDFRSQAGFEEALVQLLLKEKIDV
ncbi:MAG: phosphoribosylglycinamide formyltransferase, partial [Parasporobacterium sp.]|nr:phosphoribosylglycinamide formyltransferase [Parasporobacterium sp.]